jgi:hypothetical protein
MTGILLRQNTLVWLGLLGLAFVNGTLREVGLKRLIPEPYAHYLSAFTAIVLFTLYVFAMWRRTHIQTRRAALGIGLYWFALTILTETFVLNRWLSGLSWEDIRQSYNLVQGELWPLVLIWIACLPLLAHFRNGPASSTHPA